MLANDFIAKIGVNILFSPQVNGVANQLDKVQEALVYLGIKNIRSPMLNSDNFNQQIDNNPVLNLTQTYERFASLGYRFDFHYRQANSTTALLADAIARTANLASTYAGSVFAIEGPNEPANFPFSYNGTIYANPVDLGNIVTTDLIAAADAQSAFVSTVSLNSSYSINLQSQIADFFNAHPYPSTAGNQPYARVLGAVDAVRATLGVAPGADVPIYFTETGYSSAITSANNSNGYQFEGVSELVQAKQTLNLLVDAALLGVDGVYLYQLFNGVGEPVRDPTNWGQNLGLFRSPAETDSTVLSSAKPVATSIHNLTTILSGEPASNLIDGFAYSISGTGVDGKSFSSNSLLLDATSGAKDIIIWSEPDIWNELTNTEIAAGSAVAHLTFGTQVIRARIFDPLLGAGVQSEISYSNTVDVNISDHPLIVQIVSSGISVVGTASVNILNGGTGDDKLEGLGGNDTLDGKAGADLMVGGLGNDTYLVDNIGDIIFENANEGSDAVKASVSYTLSANVEKLTLIGTGNTNGTGGILADTLTGNAGNNVLTGLAGKDILSGGDGNDTLVGGANSDTLTGGLGNDLFVFDSLTVATDKDIIKDFTSGEDHLVINRAVFAAFAGDAAGALSASEFVVGARAQTASQHLVYNNTSGNLYYDDDGAGAHTAVLIALVQNHASIAALNAADFLLI